MFVSLNCLISLVDLSKADFLLSDLNQLIQKKNDDNLRLQNKLGIKHVENNGMLLYYLILSAK